MMLRPINTAEDAATIRATHPQPRRFILEAACLDAAMALGARLEMYLRAL